MAASHWMVAPDIEHIEHIAREIGNVSVVETTNKRIVLWCPTLYCARNLAINIKREGYYYQIRKGLKTDAWYVQAFY